MYVPAHFAVSDLVQLEQFIRSHPLATVIVHDESGLAADHLPLMLQGSLSQEAILLGHVARANPLTPKAALGIDCLIVFHGDDRYISPNWYASKQESGKVVPTWNYEAVHVSGILRIVDDSARLTSLLDNLTRTHEASQPRPWSMEDAPHQYVESLLKLIVGIEITIGEVTGKAKLSQNQSIANRQSLSDNLLNQTDSVSQRMGRAIAGQQPWSS